MFHEAIRRLLLTERSLAEDLSFGCCCIQAGSPAKELNLWQELNLWSKGFTSSKHFPTVGHLSKALKPTTCSPSWGAALQLEPVLISTVCLRGD
ncbi:hypothetical protein J4Q44_G00245430 [Coregonus suidteri]|uniref:Uncharacterized protein n=1 Tax=Coregonus suidteri TaxID=861788 RepID=A0AAN8QPL6_9TELE